MSHIPKIPGFICISYRLAVTLTVLSFIMAQTAFADFTARPKNIFLSPGEERSFSMHLATDSRNDAISGGLTFDPKLLKLIHPQVTTPLESEGFEVFGNETSEEEFRFLLFNTQDDTELERNQPILTFTIQAVVDNETLFQPSTTVVSFTDPVEAQVLPGSPLGVISVEAGGPQGIPPPKGVEFESVTFFINQVNLVEHWILYE